MKARVADSRIGHCDVCGTEGEKKSFVKTLGEVID